MSTFLKAVTLGDRLDHWAAVFPDKTALVAPFYAKDGESDYQKLSFLDLQKRANAYAYGLQKAGVVPGQIVLLMLQPGVEFVSLWFALSKLGAVLMLIDPGMGRKNLLKCIEQIGPEALISVPLIHCLSKVFQKPFSRVRSSFTTKALPLVGPLLGAQSLSSLLEFEPTSFVNARVERSSLATIAFTTGSTGVAKGVAYTQKTVSAQLEMIERSFELGQEEVSFPAFLPFSIFSVALGHTTIMPSYDSRKPALVDERMVFELLSQYRPTYSFASPAFFARVASWAKETGHSLPALKKVIMFGAPPSSRTLENLRDTLAEPGAESFTPYGATEALPVSSISSSEILGDTILKTRVGHGVCVGRPLEGVDVRIIKISDEPVENYSDELLLPLSEVGELIVAGDVVSEEYFGRADQTALAKIKDGSRVWHRMGDLAYFDKKGRIWFCGRKSQRVCTERSTLFTAPVESVFNQHPEVYKTALVGVGPKGRQRAVVCVELRSEKHSDEELARIEKELQAMKANFPHTKEVRDFLFKDHLPLDFRHNAKILREELALWAEKELGKFLR